MSSNNKRSRDESDSTDDSVIILNVPGRMHSFTYLAATSYFSFVPSNKYKIDLSRNYREVFSNVCNGKSTYGIIPFESSSNVSYKCYL